MNRIVAALGAVLLLAAEVVVAAPVSEVDMLAGAAHQQTVELVRFLRYEMPAAADVPPLRRDVQRIYATVTSIQTVALFEKPQSDGGPFVEPIEEAIRRVDALLLELRRVRRSSASAAPSSPRFGAVLAARVARAERESAKSSDPIRHRRVFADRLLALRRTLARLAVATGVNQ